MVKLENSKVARVLADNLDLTLPKVAHPVAIGARVSTSGNRFAASFGGTVFAGAYTAKGWRPLPAMTALKGKRLYTEDEAAEALLRLFAEVSAARVKK